MNIKFRYLYRDAANYKQYNYEIFSNNSHISWEQIDVKISLALKEHCWFNAIDWGLKDLHFEQWDDTFDHPWHEFELIEETTETCTKEDIIDLLLRIDSST